MTETTTHTLDAPGATLYYDVTANKSSKLPVLFVFGSPMASQGFVTLAEHFPDRTVVRYDPRSSERSKRTDGKSTTTPEEHADDLRRLIDAVSSEPVDFFATSGGAVNALVLVEQHPDNLRTLVAHEPPISAVLPDREHVAATTAAIHELYLKEGFGPAMAKFIEFLMHEGEFTADYASKPAPDPAMFGLPAEDDGSRDDALLGHNMGSSPTFEHDFEAVASASTRVVVAVGEESERIMPGRAAYGVAEQLGEEVVVFPGGHDGFLGGEYGQTGKPDEFGAKLREVLDA